jgi:hypothetical protein
MSESRTSTRDQVHGFIERLKSAADDGATTAEEIHMRAVALPLDVLERIDALGGATRELRRIEEQSIGAVYDLVRGVNHEVARLAEQWLAGARPRPRAARPRRVSRARKVRAATEAV